MSDAVISIYLDKRRPNKNNNYPVKLRVYYSYETRFYPSGINLTEEEFKNAYLTKKPRGQENKQLRIRIASVEAKANETKDELKQFSFEKFEKNFLRSSGSGNDVFYHFDQIISQLKSEERLGTASNYELSAKSIKAFLNSKNKRVVQLSFEDITITFLNDYERWMLQSGKAVTTVGIYLRPLRAVFNNAISEGEITADIYPFGKRKYQIPAGRNIKKALSKETLKILFEYPLSGKCLWEKARDFWFFSYVCNGMNIKDIAELQYKNITDTTLHFIRSKTKNTTRNDQKLILVALHPFALKTIEKYGNKKLNPDTYVFPILSPEMTGKEKQSSVQAFTRFINQHIKNLALTAGIDSKISTYWARHSFTTVSIQNGATLEFIQESLGHTNIATTMKYWKGFELSIKKENAIKLLDF